MKGPRAEIYKRYFIFSIKPSGMPFSYYKVYTFSKNHSQPLALPNLLDQGLQAINQSLLLNPFNADLHHAQRPMKCWEERDTPSKLMRHRSTSINRNKASFDCSLERKSQKYWDTMDHFSHSTALSYSSYQAKSCFSKMLCRTRCPGTQGSRLCNILNTS